MDLFETNVKQQPYMLYFYGMLKSKEITIAKKFDNYDDAKILYKCLRRHSIYIIESCITRYGVPVYY